MTLQKRMELRRKWKQFLGYLAVYALLPVFCGAVAGMLFFVRSVGAGGAEEILLSLGEQSVFAAVGNFSGNTEEAKKPGFYFLSSELLPPFSASVFTGSAKYFSTLTSPAIPEEQKTPTVLYDSLPAGATPIVKADLSSPSFFINTTKYTVNVDQVRKDVFPSSTEPQGEEPLVLVLHTHGTECYFEDDTNLSSFAPEGVESYFLQNDTSFRTSDPEKSVVQVGKVFSETLNSLGIPTLHCTVMHDKDDFNDAYYNSAQTVQEYLAKYPSIQYVIDLHRDSVVRGNSYVKTHAVIEGEESAQVMLVVGTNQNGRHPNWEQNLVVATRLKDTMDSLYPSLSRSLYLRTARFNQEFLPGCMLLEVGSAANTLQEAETAARFSARAFAEMLR